MRFVNLFCYLILAILFIGCSSSITPESTTPGDKTGNSGVTQKKITLGQLLLKQNKALKKENDVLKDRLTALEKNQSADRDNYGKQLVQLNKTIVLLEKNIKLIKKGSKNRTTIISSKKNTPPVNSISEPRTTLPPVAKQQKLVKKTGIIEEIKTPEASKAIESISLVPVINNPKTKGKKINQNKNKTSKPLPVQKQIIAESVSNERWFDTDLTPPKTPILLSVQPGAKRYYNKAFKTYSQTSYHNAINEFGQFLFRFPNDQDADNSQFWIGQCYFRLENFKLAESAFRKVLRNYKHGETQRGYKTPDAILMLGRIYNKNNKPIKSRKYYEYIVKFFPESQSANKARVELQSMSSFQ